MRPWADSVNETLTLLRDKAMAAPPPAPPAEVNQVQVKNERFFTVGCDQRHTKNLGNYESLVYGFSLSGPVPVREGDNIDSPETQSYLKSRYESMTHFVRSMMDEVRVEVENNLGSARV